MKRFELWPNLPRGSSKGEKYKILNDRLNNIADELEMDLWTLDALWWIVSEKGIEAMSASDASEDEDQFPEGKAAYRTHRYYERNSALVQKKKKHALQKGELECEICDFDFKHKYGEIGEGFIECHHNIPVSDYDSNTKTQTSLDDLSLVCSNCHRMFHRKRPCMTVDQMREIVKGRK